MSENLTNQAILNLSHTAYENYMCGKTSDLVELRSEWQSADAVTLLRMESGAKLLERCERLKELTNKCIKDLTAGRDSESDYSEDEKQQLSTFLGMIAAANIIQADDFPLDLRSPSLSTSQEGESA